MKLKPWMAVLISPFVGFGTLWVLNYLIEHLVYTIVFIVICFIGCMILAPFVTTDEEEKS
ncbi:hypothetical protein BC6_00004 [Bacillus phage BC-6]|nr:hypothetical protein BC6_00004 [Bacillus phage BC-6]